MTTAATPRPLDWHADRKRALMILLGFCVGLEFLENGMFVFAASHIVGGVDAAPRDFAQVQAAYAVGSMLMIVLQQSLSGRFGYRHYLTFSLALFMVGAAASAASNGLAALTVARLVQGFGGGALFTSSRVLVPMLFAPADRPRALKYFMMILFGMSAAAAVVAAVLTERYSWRWIFLSVIPLAGLAAAGAWTLLPDGIGRGAKRAGWAAGPLMLVAAALTLLQLALSQARFDLFDHPLQLIAIALVGAVLLLAFLFQQWHHDEPFMRLRELKHPVYVMGLVLYFLHYLLSNAASYLFPILAEQSLGINLVTSGWLSSFSATVSLLGAYAYLKLGPKMTRKKPLMVAGALLLVLSAWLFARIPPNAPPTALLLALVAKGLFGVMLILPVAGLTFRDLGDERFAHGYQSKNLMRQIAGSFSTAVAAVALADRQFVNHAHIAATLGFDSPQATNWLATMQASLLAQGIAPSQVRAAALAQLSRLVDQQSQLLSCEDLYRMLAGCALVTALVVLVQQRLK